MKTEVNLFHPHIDYEDANANVEDEKELASQLECLFGTHLNTGSVNDYSFNASVGDHYDQEMVGAIQVNFERNARRRNNIIAITKHVCWVFWMGNYTPALLQH
jgi:hypothetical protein